MSFVDLAIAKQHLRVDHEEEDALITLYLSAAESAAANFLNRNVYLTQELLDAANEQPEALPMVVNSSVKAAALLILGHLYANREEVAATSVAKLPMGALNLLYPYRVGLGV